MTTGTLIPARVDDLVLARLATSKRPPSEVEVARGVRMFAPPTLDDARWSATISESLVRLSAGNLIDKDRRPANGESSAKKRLGVSGDLTWKRVHEKIIPALALGIAGDDTRVQARLKDRDAWAAAIVGRALGLWTVGPSPSLAAACDALVWRSLRLTGNAKRTPPEVRAHFVREILQLGAGPPERLVHMLAAREVGAPRADLRALREGLVRRWLCGLSWMSGELPSTPDFASAVREAAERATEGVFGGRKVFISTVWRGLRAQPAFRDLPLDAFKERLVAAHKAGQVALARADLTAAMDPAAVRESETSHLEARYHFVERGGAS